MIEKERRELELLRDLGFTHLNLRLSAAKPGAEIERGLMAGKPEGDSSVAESSGMNLPVPVGVFPGDEQISAAPDLHTLGLTAAPCTRCRLASTRTQVVFGTGNPEADLMFIGEAPGRDEDLAGEPFVGRAGQLLTDIIKAMKLTREQVYIANVIKCRPPENRNPEPDEMEACRPYIERQIEFIKPRVIVTLGRFALQSTLRKPLAISSVRGVWQQYGSIKVMPTYHPAYLLRTPSAKKDVWADMKKVMVELGLGII